MRWVKAIYRVLHGWWEPERQRRELSMMRARDFGDLAVPPSLVTDELRRWPWHRTRNGERSQRGGAAAMPSMARETHHNTVRTAKSGPPGSGA
jgi:uncharacterized protein YjiS (DUF1127 family)